MPESIKISAPSLLVVNETEEQILQSSNDQWLSWRNGLSLVSGTVTRYYLLCERGQSGYLRNLNVILIRAFIIGTAVTKIVTVNYIWSFTGKGCLILNNHC